MLGVFDSGFGGYYTLQVLKEHFPQLDYIFYADNKNVPYGNKTPEQIQKLTFDGLQFLFDNGADMVILACNTASAFAIRAWQQSYPHKKVLSVTIPGIEKAIENNYKYIGILATQATVISNIYPSKFKEIYTSSSFPDIYQTACPTLVDIIEQKITDEYYIESEIKKYLDRLPENIECIILGCTHYPLLRNYFEKYFKGDIIDPSYESAVKLRTYFEKHQDIYDNISKNGETKIYFSGENKFL